MGGWKTWISAALVAGSSVLHYIGQTELANLVLGIGGSFGLVGIGHKIEKSGSN